MPTITLSTVHDGAILASGVSELSEWRDNSIRAVDVEGQYTAWKPDTTLDLWFTRAGTTHTCLCQKQ